MSALQPRAGVHYPRSAGEFRSWFGSDEDCLDYLDWLRWPDGFVCPRCAHRGGWKVADGRYKCAACGGRTSVTAGTMFDRRRTPLTVWFEACWVFASGKDGTEASATSVGAGHRQWRNGSLEVTVTLPPPRFCTSASGCKGIVGTAAAVSPTSATLDTTSDQPLLRRAQKTR